MKKKVLVIIGTVRKNRTGETVGKWIMNNLPSSNDVDFELVDLRDFNLPFFDEPTSPMYSGGKFENPNSQKWLDKIKEADGYIILTAEYNHSIPGVLKNALDFWYSEYTKNKPVTIVSYGGISAGTRAAEHLKQVCLELKLIPLHSEVNIPMIWEAFNENGDIKDDQYTNQLKYSLSNLVKELE